MGAWPEDIWESFNNQPIASASLAQVHLAVDKLGRKCAVKVQHEGLIESSFADLKAITTVVSIASLLFENFSYDWLAREMNRNLPLELCFKEEAKNLLKAGSMLKDNSVAVPTIYNATDRVLSMSFEEGCYVTNVDELRRLNIDCSEVARIISETFSEQTFRHGFVHCGMQIIFYL